MSPKSRIEMVRPACMGCKFMLDLIGPDRGIVVCRVSRAENRRIALATGRCPMGLWTAADLTSPPRVRSDAPRSLQMMPRRVSRSRRKRWEEVAETWSAAQKAMNLITSIASGRLGDSEDDQRTLSLRVLSCHGDVHEGGKVPPCPSRRFSKGKAYHYCNDCGCGERELARISDRGSEDNRPVIEGVKTKLGFRKLACPRRRQGFSNAE